MKPRPANTCQAADCRRTAPVPAIYCPRHLRRLQLHGSLERLRRVANWPSLNDKFDHYVKPGAVSECWEYTGSRSVSGYGVVNKTHSGMVTYAHRFSYERANGPIPDGLIIRHACDNPPCVNPSHLLVGTHADNTRDKVERDRQTKGVTIPQHKLTPDQVRQIREAYDTGLTMQQVGDMFGVVASTVHRVVRRNGWRHVA